MKETRSNWVLLTAVIKKYGSVRPQACKQSLLVLSSNGKVKERVLRAGVAKAEWPEAG